MRAHFFDIDTLINLDGKVWIVSKDNPNFPIIKIEKWEFNLIKSGLYKSQDSSLKMDGLNYWLPNRLLNDLKIKCKIKNINISNLAFSMQEFLNPNISSNIDWKILEHNFKHLKNKTDDIYIICSKMDRKSYFKIIEKLKFKLEKLGLKIKNFYYISETFYNSDSDPISYEKVKLMVQHFLGLKTHKGKFINENIESYEQIYYYDVELKSIELAKNINSVLLKLMGRSDMYIKNIIKNTLRKDPKFLHIRYITNNMENLFQEDIVQVGFGNINNKFEGYFLYKNK